MSNVVVSPAPFVAPKRLPVPHGVTIQEIVAYVYEDRGIPAICRMNDLIVEINGSPVHRDQWITTPKENDHVMVYMPVRGGGGGKNPLRTLLTIALVVAAPAIGAGIAGVAINSIYAGASIVSVGAFGVASAIATAGVLTAGMMLINALAPIRPPSSATRQDYKDSSVYSLTGARNQMNPYGPVPVVLGTHRFYPPLAAKPYTQIIDNEEYLYLLFAWCGPCKIEDIKIGETPLSSYSGFATEDDWNSNIEIREGWDTDADITIFPTAIDQTDVNVKLVHTDGWTDRTVGSGYTNIGVDIAFPRGLVRFDDQGNRQNASVSVRVRYREVGALDWIYLDQSFSYIAIERGATTNPFSAGTWSVYAETSGNITFYPGTSAREGSVRLGTFNVDIDFNGLATLSNVINLTVSGRTGLVISLEHRLISPGVYEWFIKVSSGSVIFGAAPLSVTAATPSLIRKTLSGPVDPAKTYEVGLMRDTVDSTSDQLVDEVYWATIRATTNNEPLNFPVPMSKIAIRIKASEGIQNQADIINCLVSSYAPKYVSGSWQTVGVETTNNPAALYRLVLMHPANHKARTTSQIDDAALGAWYDFCVTNGYAFNQIRDFTSSVWEALADISFAGRGAPAISYGLWGVDVDTSTRTIDAHITPRNSWNFSAEKILFDRPHGFRVIFNNENKNYLEDERIVYDDGYNGTNASIIERLEFRGITNPDLIWKFARFHIAQARLRPEIYTLSMDFEHLTFTRNSLVMVSHDVPRWGDHWGRVKSISTSGSNTTGVVIDEVVTMELGGTYACRFRLSDGTSSVISITTVVGETDTLTFATPVPTVSGPQVDDLAMFNVSDQTAVELICTGIRRQNDFVAECTFVDHSPEIYNADTGLIPAFNSRITGSIYPTVLPTPTITRAESYLFAEDIATSRIVRKIIVYEIINFDVQTLSDPIVEIRYRLKGANEPWAIASNNSVSPVEISVPVDGIYELQARYSGNIEGLSIYGRRYSGWSNIYEVTITSITSIGLPTPTGIVGFYELDNAGRVVRVKIRLTVENTGVVPNAVALMFSVQEQPREVDVIDNNTYLTISGVEILQTGTFQILSGSTKNSIVITTPENPLPELNLAGMFWGDIDGTGFRKATGSTTTAIEFAEGFASDPVIGGTFTWIEISWADERDASWKYLNLVDSSGHTEVAKWSTVTEVGNEYRIGGLTRAQEGTTQVNAIKAQYYPAPGAGTQTYIIPVQNFVHIGNFVFEGSTDVEIDIPAGGWIASTLATYMLEGMRVTRSNIVPITDWRPL